MNTTHMPYVETPLCAQFNVAYRSFRHARRRAAQHYRLGLSPADWRRLADGVLAGQWTPVDDSDPNDPHISFWQARLHGRTVVIAFCELTCMVRTFLAPHCRTARAPRRAG